jgi:hypothetical protein
VIGGFHLTNPMTRKLVETRGSITTMGEKLDQPEVGMRIEL